MKLTTDAVAAKLDGTPTRFEPPTSDHQREADGADLDVTLRFFGMTRRIDGSAWLKPHRTPRATGLPVRTQRFIEDCAKLGLLFWSEARAPRCVWAVDDQMQAHLVRMNNNGSATIIEHDQ